VAKQRRHFFLVMEEVITFLTFLTFLPEFFPQFPPLLPHRNEGRFFTTSHRTRDLPSDLIYLKNTISV